MRWPIDQSEHKSIPSHKQQTLFSRSSSSTTDAYRRWNSLSIGSWYDFWVKRRQHVTNGLKIQAHTLKKELPFYMCNQAKKENPHLNVK